MSAVSCDWDLGARTLAERDPVMAAMIAHAGEARLTSRGDAFLTLARSIVGQQISVKAADTVWGRLCERVDPLLPQHLVAVGIDGLVGCGLSQRKMLYLDELARGFLSGALQPESWRGMDDDSVIRVLCEIRGIGRWTAEMFLIFNLQRPDVFPLDDVGLQRAVAQSYCAGVKPTRAELQALGERWRPWRSLATWYLWRDLDPVPVAY